ncbi:MAG TPA: beta-eliminating lyase-related protein [Steroidobacteraceae bacterium]|nr:beta-eliminating lyase-related protein [Steroidobacteraceae bacterium]
METIEPGWQFASDNTAGICPEAWGALAAANVGYAPSYGDDRWTQRASDLIRELFERPQAQVFFVFNGTAANSLGLAALCQSYHGIVCHEQSHVQTDECAAPEFFSHGAKLLTAAGPEAKLAAAAVLRALERREDLHCSKPRALSISQTTEWGSLYQPSQIAELSAIARAHGLALHMDGARFANALAALRDRGFAAADLTWRAGVDVLSLGGTKGGLNTTEAVVFFNAAQAEQFDYRCKQGAQLASKMRFQSSQWVGVLESGAWLRHAAHANASAAALAAALQRVAGLQPLRAVEANAVFIELDTAVAEAMSVKGWHFHRMGEAGFRLMCSWATRAVEIERFVADLAQSQRQ